MRGKMGFLDAHSNAGRKGPSVGVGKRTGSHGSCSIPCKSLRETEVEAKATER